MGWGWGGEEGQRFAPTLAGTGSRKSTQVATPGGRVQPGVPIQVTGEARRVISVPWRVALFSFLFFKTVHCSLFTCVFIFIDMFILLFENSGRGSTEEKQFGIPRTRVCP